MCNHIPLCYVDAIAHSWPISNAGLSPHLILHAAYILYDYHMLIFWSHGHSYACQYSGESGFGPFGDERSACPSMLACPDSKVHGPNMGPTWVLSAPDGPHFGPMNFAIRDVYNNIALLSVSQKLHPWGKAEIEPLSCIHSTCSHGSVRGIMAFNNNQIQSRLCQWNIGLVQSRWYE